MYNYPKFFCFLIFLTTIFFLFIYSHYFQSQSNKSTKSNPIFQMVNELNIKPKNNYTITMDSVFRFVPLPLDFKYGSNSIPLTVACLLALSHSNENILELGMGMFSTPLLHSISSNYERMIVSVDTNFDWLEKFLIYNKTSSHRIFYLNTNEMISFGLNEKWSVVLIDHIDASMRSINVKRFSKLAQIVVVHDTEKKTENYYGFEKNKIRDSFKYHCKYSLYQNREKSNYISTLILSNFIDLNNLKDIFNEIITDFGHVACDLNFK